MTTTDRPEGSPTADEADRGIAGDPPPSGDGAPTTNPPARAASTVPRFLDVGARWGWRILVVAAAVYLLGQLYLRLRVVVLPVLIALVLSALLSVPVRWIVSRVPRLLAVWAVLLALLGLMVGLGFLVVPPLASQFSGLGDNLDTAVEDARQWLQDEPLNLSREQIEDFERSVRDVAVGGAGGQALSNLRRGAEFIAGILLTFVLTFFFLKDGPAMWRWITARVRPERREAVDTGGQAAFGALRGWLLGVAITGVIDAALIGIGLWVIGVPAVIPLVVLTFFAAFFPVIGATVAGALAALVALVANGPTDALFVAGLTLVVQQVEGDIVMPMIMRRQVSLHPAVILVVLTAGGAIAGIVGALLAVPLTAAVTAAVAAVRSERGEVGEARTPAAVRASEEAEDDAEEI